jgi:putative copper export protein
VDAVRVLHLLAMAFFVGGQLLLVAALVPVLRGEPHRPLLRKIARRFGVGSLVALAVLAVTGAAMAGRFERWGEGTLHVKLALVALVVGLVAWHIRRPGHHAIEGVVFLVSLAIVVLGVRLTH